MCWHGKEKHKVTGRIGMIYMYDKIHINRVTIVLKWTGFYTVAFIIQVGVTYHNSFRVAP